MFSFWFLLYLALIISCLLAYRIGRKYLPPYFSYFQYLFAAAVIFDLSGEILKDMHINNYFLDHFYQIIELTILSVIFWHAIENDEFRHIISVTTILAVLLSLVLSVGIEGVGNKNRLSLFLSSALIILYSLRYLRYLNNSQPTQESILLNPLFWIVAAHLLYYYGDYFYMAPMGFIESTSVQKEIKFIDKKIIFDYQEQELRILHMVLNYTLYILYLTGFLCRRKFIFR